MFRRPVIVGQSQFMGTNHMPGQTIRDDSSCLAPTEQQPSLAGERITPYRYDSKSLMLYSENALKLLWSAFISWDSNAGI